MSEVDDLLPVTLAAQRAGVGRNTMLLAAKRGTIRSKRIGKNWFVFASDLERWKRDVYRPDMAFHYPSKTQDAEDDTS